MARLISFKKTVDDNKYRTFGNENNSINNSNENIYEMKKCTNIGSKNKCRNQKKKKKLWHYLCCWYWCNYYCCFRLCCYHHSDINNDDSNDHCEICYGDRNSCCCRCCCCSCWRRCCNKYNLDDNTDDDIDQRFTQFKRDLKINEQNTSTTTTTTITTMEMNLKGKYWDWNDSLRSNSDKFLETLEYQFNGDDTLKRIGGHGHHKLPTIKISPVKGESTPDVGNSPEMGKQSTSVRSTSPAPASPASTDPWPSQPDEDIDRLVAMHQNRSSLSSLGLRSDSMASVYSGAGEGRYGTVVVKGQIEFGMQYNYKQGALEIHIVKCKELAAVDTKRHRSDPYVKLYLLPDKSKTGKRKTKVKKHTLNPTFDETLKFHMSLSSLESRTLWATVWHSDMFGRNDFLGEVSIPLRGKIFDNTQPQWYLLQERSEPFDDITTYKGDIIVGLKYIPPIDNNKNSSQNASGDSSNTLIIRKFGSLKSPRNSSTASSSTSLSSTSLSKGSLHVLVKEGKNLSAIKANGTCDAFCKSYLLPDKSRSSKQKTPVVKRSMNPNWNYTFVYDNVSLAELSERALELTVWDHDRLASNEFLGGVRFSLGSGKYQDKNVDWMDATGKELSLWQSMLNRPNFWVEGCVVLRSTLDNSLRFSS